MGDSNDQRSPDAGVGQVAAHFGVTPRTVRRWIKATGMPHRRIGITLRFNIAEVDDWAAEQASESVA